MLLHLISCHGVDQVPGLSGEVAEKVRRATSFQASFRVHEFAAKPAQRDISQLKHVFRLYNVLCPVTARLKPVSLMWACMP